MTDQSTILAQIPRAQAAYNEVTSSARWIEMDTTELLESCKRAILRAIELTAFVTAVDYIPDMVMAEKAALQLEELGYSTTVTSGTPIPMLDGGGQRSSSRIMISWMHMPANKRDAYTV